MPSAFYIYALYAVEEADDAYRLLRKMLPGPDEKDIVQRGQLPVFIPNYYRGAYRLYPRTAGRSSHLFNTGTAAWYYRCLIDGLFGLQGCRAGLSIRPQLPSHWEQAKVTRTFRGATLHLSFARDRKARQTAVYVDGALIDGTVLTGLQPGRTYKCGHHPLNARGQICVRKDEGAVSSTAPLDFPAFSAASRLLPPV